MKILRVISSMNPKGGGPCQGIRNAIPALVKLGVESEVVCLDDATSSYLGNDPFKIHAIGAAKAPWAYQKELIPWLLANFQNYDIVVVHGLWLYHSHASVKALNSFKKKNAKAPKLFIMPHGMLDPYFQKAKERKMKALRNDIYWKLFENKVVNNADGILFTCEEELLLARTTFPNYKPKQELNVGYGIQAPPAYSPAMRDTLAQKVPTWNNKPFLVFLSRVHSKKGIDLLIKAYLKLEKEQGNLPQLLIAGPGLESDYGKQMQQLAATSANILFPGMLSGDAKWGAFYESEAFVLPSHQENFGIAVVEALACSKPVLISDKVNIWREIEEAKGGIVKNDTELETYKMLQEWISYDKVKKQEMSKNAFLSYKKYFTIEHAAAQFLTEIKNA